MSLRHKVGDIKRLDNAWTLDCTKGGVITI